jgi:KipI family sensor histidine kinase inhibitor
VNIREAGDAALLVELEAVIDPAINARAIGIADALRRAALPGVLDVVPTFHSVAVYLDPAAADREAIRAALLDACVGRDREATPPQSQRVIDVPVVYGGDEGPDLAEVASFAGISEADVIARHSERSYRVYMLGFLPGFAYMATVDERIAAPRKPTPRLKVAAGSVGIAGAQTGIYPRTSPGGWQIIGRTVLDVFDAARSPAALFAPGDMVRFVPTHSTDVGAGFSRPDEVRLKADPAYARSITVISPGLLTTVQDRGRWGHQASGVPVAGPMDRVSHDAANAAVGNGADAATLEVTLAGPELRLEHDAWVVVSGADLGATVDGAMLAPGAPRRAGAGAVVRFGGRRHGARAYLAFDGGIDAPLVLGSRSTHVAGGFGRALRSGDRLPLGVARRPTTDSVAPRQVPAGGARLRARRGPQDDRFPMQAFEQLRLARFQVGPQSDRMGYRLAGSRLPAGEAGAMISGATFAGGLQVPPSGEPILLMADRQTTGGYPQIATLLHEDVSVAGQLAPGDWIEFELADDVG